MTCLSTLTYLNEESDSRLLSMGDTRRHRTFVRFVNRTYPRMTSALVVADGKGRLARLLSEHGVRVRVIEADGRYVGEPDPLIQYEEGWFERSTPVYEDVILGMHPDEATAEIILAANKNKKPFAVVPCCVLGREAEGVRDNFFA